MTTTGYSYGALVDKLLDHINDKNNPHEVTSAQTGGGSGGGGSGSLALVEGNGIDISSVGNNRTISVEQATTTNFGGVLLSNAIDSNNEQIAATSKAVNDVRSLIEEVDIDLREGEGIDISTQGSRKTISIERATTTNLGGVVLSNLTDSNDSTRASTSKAVNTIRKLAETKVSSILAGNNISVSRNGGDVTISSSGGSGGSGGSVGVEYKLMTKSMTTSEFVSWVLSLARPKDFYLCNIVSLDSISPYIDTNEFGRIYIKEAMMEFINYAHATVIRITILKTLNNALKGQIYQYVKDSKGNGRWNRIINNEDLSAYNNTSSSGVYKDNKTGTIVNRYFLPPSGAVIIEATLYGSNWNPSMITNSIIQIKVNGKVLDTSTIDSCAINDRAPVPATVIASVRYKGNEGERIIVETKASLSQGARMTRVRHTQKVFPV